MIKDILQSVKATSIITEDYSQVPDDVSSWHIPDMRECPETGQYGNNLVGRNTVILCELDEELITDISIAIKNYMFSTLPMRVTVVYTSVTERKMKEFSYKKIFDNTTLKLYMIENISARILYGCDTTILTKHNFI